MSKWNWRPNEGAKINRTKQRMHTKEPRKMKKTKKKTCTAVFHIKERNKKRTPLNEPVLWMRYEDA